MKGRRRGRGSEWRRRRRRGERGDDWKGSIGGGFWEMPSEGRGRLEEEGRRMVGWSFLLRGKGGELGWLEGEKGGRMEEEEEEEEEEEGEGPPQKY